MEGSMCGGMYLCVRFPHRFSLSNQKEILVCDEREVVDGRTVWRWN